jgi:hypothetical protein
MQKDSAQVKRADVEAQLELGQESQGRNKSRLCQGGQSLLAVKKGRERFRGDFYRYSKL